MPVLWVAVFAVLFAIVSRSALMENWLSISDTLGNWVVIYTMYKVGIGTYQPRSELHIREKHQHH